MSEASFDPMEMEAVEAARQELAAIEHAIATHPETVRLIRGRASQTGPVVEIEDRFLEDFTAADGSTIQIKKAEEVGDESSVRVIPVDRDKLWPTLEFRDDAVYPDLDTFDILEAYPEEYWRNSEGEPDYFLPKERLVQEPGFRTAVHQIYTILTAPRPELAIPDQRQHPIPKNIDITVLPSEVSETLTEDFMPPELAPRFQFNPDTGDAWYGSPLVSSDGRTYQVLYRPTDEGLTPFVVYRSSSQAVWRLLPRIIHTQDHEYFHDKGPDGFEEALNLPIELQAALNKLEATHPSTDDQAYEALQILQDIANRTYDPDLSGGNVQHIKIESKPDANEWLPQSANTAEQTFAFKTRLYGDITAHIVSSPNQALRYLVLESGEATWVGSTEPAEAHMLDSFVLTQAVTDYDLYAPPMEYAADVSQGYVATKAKAIGDSAIQAFHG